ncbi:MAG: Tetraacyldisaccharide 4'-kinase (EC [uncultured Sulfurovum sp.]|uniref:Tetraacyldisaccharide 4'-kinase n=1 Tax=uncultured Sulfurovum sp. TaxID=269237 RepID=A0A6S6RXA2_9BACT|nr:MAG: Tetraacyldisaccharide 4'-kinase (EC [uncultured Sulfurovum sp.]
MKKLSVFVQPLKKLRMHTSKLTLFFERLFFKPNLFDWVLILLLSPFSLIYAHIMLFRRLFTFKKSYAVPIVSIGNLTVGGSGKTPFVIALAKHYDNAYIISRGYGRESRGLVEVSRRGQILTDVFNSGDEAMLMAKSLPDASVMVSENREVAIEKAIENSAKVIFLDDGFNRVNIKKYEILLFPKKIVNYFTFPAGPFREFFFMKYFANLVLYEEIDFKRIVETENKTEKMLLLTAISNPERLKPFLPKGVVGEVYLDDHAYFNEREVEEKFVNSTATSLLVTEKDAVKMKEFKFPLSVMKLKLQIKNQALENIHKYIEEHANER